MKIHVSKLIKYVNPFRMDIWQCGILSKRMVTKALKNNELAATPGERFGEDHDERIYHARRIAFLVKNGWKDKIEIDVGIPVLNYYRDHILLDGHHRLAAAIYRGDKFINADVAGQISYAKKLFKPKKCRIKEKQPEQSCD